jgi:hypothetical protein
LDLRDFDLDDVVLIDAHREGVDGQVGGKRQCAAGAHVELRSVPRADNDALFGIEFSLGERAVVMRAAILDGAQLAVHVEDPDEDVARADDLDGARR